MRVTTYNSTSFARSEWVLFGSNGPGNVLETFPRSFLNVGKITIPAMYEGEVDIDPDTDPNPFTFHSAIPEAFAAGLQLAVTVNGSRTYFSPVKNLAQNNRCRIDLLRARTPDAIIELITYTFHKQCIVKYELAVFCESLITPQKALNITFDVIGAEGRIYNVMRFADAQSLIHTTMDDTAGRLYHGSLMFINESVLANSTESSTVAANFTAPLYAMTPWAQWGPWAAPTVRVDRPEVITEFLQAAGKPYWQTLGHFGGEIGNMASGDTGDQGGFGPWKSTIPIGAGNAATLYFDLLRTSQEFCRPVNYFELNGDPVTSLAHPQWHTWSQRTHWHSGVSPDRLGRLHNGNLVSAWTGYDRQHDTTSAIANMVILLGSYACKRWIERKIESELSGETVPSIHGSTALNDIEGGGRGMGRPMVSAVHMWMATGDNRILNRMALRIKECLFPHYNTTNNNSGTMKVMRIITGDARAMGGRPTWIVWEDTIGVMGLDAMYKALQETNIHTEILPQLDDIIWNVSRTYTMHGWMKDRLQQVYFYVWDGSGNPIPDTSYNDPNLVQPGDGTDVRYWGIPALSAAYTRAIARGDQVVANLAINYIRQLVPTKSTYARTYLGATTFNWN